MKIKKIKRRRRRRREVEIRYGGTEEIEEEHERN